MRKRIMTVEDIKERVCSGYCKYADFFRNRDTIEPVCRECPLNELTERRKAAPPTELSHGGPA